jgi:ABC-type transport system involved in multi-copper enzyme maturation permease subunit
VSGSLLKAEVLRFRSRRFIQLLLVLGVLGLLVGVGVAATQFAKASPERLVAAEQERDEIIRQQEVFRQQCLADPPTAEELGPGAPTDQPPEFFCGEPLTPDQLPASQFIDPEPFVLADGLPGAALGVAGLTAALTFVLGATYVGAEWSSRSMVALLFWEPRRGRVMATKLAVLAVAAAALGVLAQAAWTLAALVLARTRGVSDGLPPDFWSDVLGQQGRSVLLAVLTAMLGFAVANLVRNTGAALGVGFLYFAIIENILRVTISRSQRYLLSDNIAALLLDGGHRVFINSGTTLDPATGSVSFDGREVVLSNVHGGLVLGLVTAALVGLGVVLFARRDLH